MSQWSTGQVSVIDKESHSPTLLSDAFKAAADICLSADGKRLLVPDMTAGTLSAITLADYPAVQLDESPLPITASRAFPQLDFVRPIVLTHAGDGSNRVFVATELGKVYVFPNDQGVEKAELFFDLEDKVSYKDTQNEEGFLGMAFHPKFKENGELFVYYSTKEVPLTSVISRFKLGKDGKRIDPKSEEEDPPDPAAVLEPQRRHHRFRPRRLSLHRLGRRRQGERSVRACPESQDAARLDPANRR